MADRDCENCKNYTTYEHNGEILYACSAWDCHFEPKESADESTKKTADGKSETGDM